MNDPADILVYTWEQAQQDVLGHYGFRVASDEAQLLSLQKDRAPKLLCIDARDGWQNSARRLAVARSLQLHERTPIVALVATADECSEQTSLLSGVDACVSSPKELITLSPSQCAVGTGRERLRYSDLELDHAQHKVWRSGRLISLPALQFRLLEFLMRHPSQVFSRSELLEHIWRGSRPHEGAVIACMARLRRALALPGLPQLIRNARGGGYSLDSDAAVLNSPSPRRTASAGNKSVTAASPQCHSDGLADHRPGG